jgi:hypothetical protein
MARRLTNAEYLAAWRVHGELAGGHSPQQTLGFVGALMDLEDDERSRPLPDGVVSPDGVEPKWLGRLRRWTGRG